MKKLLIAVFILAGICCKAQQPIDTVYVRNLQLRYDEWKWLKGGWQPNDSTSKKAFRRIESAVNAAGNPSNSLMITVDSIPGKVALTFLIMHQSAPTGITRLLTNDIRQNIRAYTPMLPFCNGVDVNYAANLLNQTKNGKDDFNKSN